MAGNITGAGRLVMLEVMSIADDFPAPPEDMILTVLLIVEDQDRSREFYERVLGAETVLERDPVIMRFRNSWIIFNVGGGPPRTSPRSPWPRRGDPNTVSGCMNVRVADVHAVYEDWKAKGAEFITPPVDHGPEIRCYLRDPDGHLIEVRQSTGG